MGAHRWLRFGDLLSLLIPYSAGLLAIYVLSPAPRHVGAWSEAELVAGLCIAFLLGIVVHELGHVLAIRLAGSRPIAMHILSPPDRIAFHGGALRVGLGINLARGGEVEYPARGLSAAQSVVVAVAGPAADLVTAPLVLLLPVPERGTGTRSGQHAQRQPGTFGRYAASGASLRVARPFEVRSRPGATRS